MQTELKSRPAVESGLAGSATGSEKSELELLAEFMRHDSVASLAGDIAERLGVDVRGDDLIAAAGLGGSRGRAASGKERRGAERRALTDAQDFAVSLERLLPLTPAPRAEPRNSFMTSTTSAYLAVSQNLPRYQAMTAAEPAVKSATAYYEANIGSVTSIKDFVGNYRLLSYALDAYGLGGQIDATALITKVLEGGVSNPNSLANTLSNSAWKAFATAFNFVGAGASSISSSKAVETTASDYVEQQLESDQGAQQDVGVELALYFQRVAPTVTSEFGILADPNLLQVAQTIFGLSPSTSAENINKQAQTLSQLMPISDLQDPAKLKQLTERFTAMYDLTYGPGSGATTNLTVSSSNSTSAQSGAVCGSRGHHQRERLDVERRPQRLHRRADASLFDLPVVEPAEVFARRLKAGRTHGTFSAKGPRKRRALVREPCFRRRVRLAFFGARNVAGRR